MLVDDANRLADGITERIGGSAAAAQGVKAKVHVDQIRAEGVPRGAGRPIFSRYFVQVEDTTRVALVDLDSAGALLDELDSSWDADKIFDAIRARDVEVQGKE